jgi:hypothetical protein
LRFGPVAQEPRDFWAAICVGAATWRRKILVLQRHLVRLDYSKSRLNDIRTDKI